MHVHFDGDLLVYRCGFAAEKQEWEVWSEQGALLHTCFSKREAIQWAEDAELRGNASDDPADYLSCRVVKGERFLEPVENALANVKSMVNQALESLGCSESEMTMYLSGPTNFRTGIATIKEYKGNRDPDHKPAHGPAIKEYMEHKYNTVYSVDEEADDLVGHSHYAMWLRDEQSTIIATVDKDMDMIPGLHYNFVKDESYYVSPEEAIRWFYMQLLMGDSTDNIPGIPRVGPAKAAKMLADAQTEWELYCVARDAYEQAYEDGPAALIENAQLLWIRRQPNEWWVPPQDEHDLMYG